MRIPHFPRLALLFLLLCLLPCSLSIAQTQTQDWNLDVDREAQREPGVLFLHDEIQGSGLNQLNEFLQFGSAALRDRRAESETMLRQADPFDRTDARARVSAVVAEIAVAQAQIAGRTFYGEFTYQAPLDRVQVDGDRSSFTMVIPTGFSGVRVENISFPMRDVTGTREGEHREQVLITVSGSTDSIRELVRNNASYRAKVWFTNLRLGNNNVITAHVTKVEVIEAPGLEHAGQRNVLRINNVEYAFRWCPAGSFMMGNPPRQVLVTLSRGFWMLETPVTQAMWESVMGNNLSHFRGATLPVERVSWNDAQQFIQRLNELGVAPAGFRFSLPTEAQWEYACRAGTTTAFSFGDTLTREQANFGVSIGQTTEVGRFPANAWGFRDMHGNVSEWCQDWFGDYPGGAVTDPTGPSTGSFRVHRGGDWNSLDVHCRSASRSGIDPTSRRAIIGLRIALVGAESR